ncbi:MAG: HD domain-containing protein [Candidatus Brocadiaceae bacterium]|jgi:putative two-component system response regulator
MDETDALNILIVDSDRRARENTTHALRWAGYRQCVGAEDAETARRFLRTRGPFALVILDIQIGRGKGLELLEELAPLAPRTVLIVVTEAHGLLTAIDCLKRGAYDYVLKPIDAETVQLSVGLALQRRRRELEERSSRTRLMEMVEKRVGMLEKTRSALLRAMCRMAEFRDPHGPVHPERVAQYAYLLAEQLGHHSPYAPVIDQDFLLDIYESALLHDIGKVVLPDEILRKPGDAMTAEDRTLVRAHAVRGREICLAVKEELGGEEDRLIDMAAAVAGAHHERWDGDGYPDGLRRSEIPLPARVVGLADYYDIWRTPMVYRPEVLPREAVRRRVEERSGTRFDPAVVEAFKLRWQDIQRVDKEWQR